ncbi:hypothetical protein ACLBKS_00095 [Hylemonella sp. W303a]|uniref:hypothetical protein n=1 Tax=Hylemonella sp. W303a TaxID=3389873 RepID=UPI00396AF7A7
MLSASTEIGNNYEGLFDVFYAELGRKRVREILGVCSRTIDNWRHGTTRVPKAVVLALYWETQYGRSLIECEMINEIQLLYQQNTILRDQFRKAKDIVAGLRRLQTGTANEAYFDDLTDCYEKHQTFPSQFIVPDARQHFENADTPRAVDWYFGVPTQPEADKAEAIPPRRTAAAA